MFGMSAGTTACIWPWRLREFLQHLLVQEEFARAASLFATKPATEAAEKDMFADSDGDDDMFADSDAEGDKPKGPSGKAKKPQAAAAAPDPQSAEAQSAAGGQIAAADKAAAAGSAAPASSAGWLCCSRTNLLEECCQGLYFQTHV